MKEGGLFCLFLEFWLFFTLPPTPRLSLLLVKGDSKQKGLKWKNGEQQKEKNENQKCKGKEREEGQFEKLIIQKEKKKTREFKGQQQCFLFVFESEM